MHDAARCGGSRACDSFVGKGVRFYVDKANEAAVLIDGVEEGLKRTLVALMKDDLDNNNTHVSFHLYTGLRVKAENSEGSVMFHANPFVEGSPWHDDVVVHFEDNGGGVSFCFAKIMTFVDVFVCDRSSGTGVHTKHVLLHMYCAINQRKRAPHERIEGEGNNVFDIDDELFSCGIDGVPLCRGRAAYVVVPSRRGRKTELRETRNPYFILVDTESISGGVWTQEDFDHPGTYWFIRHPLLLKKQE